MLRPGTSASVRAGRPDSAHDTLPPDTQELTPLWNKVQDFVSIFHFLIHFVMLWTEDQIFDFSQSTHVVPIRLEAAAVI